MHLALTAVLALPCLVHATPAWAPAGAARPVEGFVAANGVRLQYLDHGGAGPTLILVHGLADDPHSFDDLAPAFTDRFHVIAYARRGSGNSEVCAPYDIATLTEDLRGLMDALGVAQATLVGHSAGGNEITAMAAKYPERVARLVYLDAAYDWSDPDYLAAFKVRPVFTRPASSMVSLDAYRSYEKGLLYASLDDMSRIDAYLLQKVVLQPDGSVEERTPKPLRDSLYAALFASPPRAYTRIRCPVLALYAQNWYPPDMVDPQRRREAAAYDIALAPFRKKSIDRVKREIAGVTLAEIPGAHSNFLLLSRPRVVGLMKDFLGAGIAH